MGLFSHDVKDDVLVSATFPDTNPFGLVVNGQATPLALHLVNAGSNNYALVSASSSYHNAANNWALVKNATTLKYNVPLAAGANYSAPYTLHSEYRPQELGLTVWVNLIDSSKTIHRITAYNQTVSIVEPPSSFFDPSLILLYTLLTSALLGGAYLMYNSFFAPQQKGKKSIKKVKAVVVNDKPQDYPNVKPYEEEWIPAQHLKSRQGKVRKDGKGDVKVVQGEVRAGETSGGEVTSGGESGREGTPRKRKGKKA